ncbi:MAG: tetratricopeptide repeat protein, partial [Pseudomonadota bacterium]|nr:tetratricopeptide repeat protein [Pseudomonadota bacterium]
MASDRADPLIAAEAAVRAGTPKAALAPLTAAVKAAPAQAQPRIFLAQLLCVLGQWERAHTQLNVVADLDDLAGPMREMVGHALRCEKIRAAVFEGRRSPMVFGEPESWLASLIESLLRSG